MTVLDDLTGYEFEDLMVEVFRELGYEDVRRAERTNDMGRDIVMHEEHDGGRRAVVIECKHTDVVSRPVLQKLHSAVATYDYEGTRRGVAVTTGRFTAPAREYAEALEESGDPYPIELVDGRALREIADEVGLDLRNGRVELLCDETLPTPRDPREPLHEAVGDVDNLDVDDVDSTVHLRLTPAVATNADVDATFETGIGVVHRVDETVGAVLLE